MSEQIIWTYWEDAPGIKTPPHILLCREVLRYQSTSCDIRLVTPANVHDYLPDLDPRVWHIELENSQLKPIAVRCDFIRAFLLERYGGLYVDSDCIALKDFSVVFRDVGEADFFAMRRTSSPTNHISVGFYGSQPQGKIITSYAEALRRRLCVNAPYRWSEVGANLLTPIVDQHLDKVHLFPEVQVHPIVAEQQHRLADNTYAIADIVSSNAYCLMLFHRLFEQEVEGITLAHASVHDLYRGQWLISKVLRQAYPERVFKCKFGQRPVPKTVGAPLAAPVIATRYETERLIERIGYWVPPENLNPVPPAEPKTNLRIAAVVEERLYQGFRNEADMMLLTPNNWKYTIQYGKADFLLMESIWTTATGHWHMAQCPPAAERNKLLEMISFARQKAIPSVFWMTKNNVYHEHYKSFARHFDFVFCADPIEAEKMRKEGIGAEILLPCALLDKNVDRKNRNISILFDGWADLDKYTADLDGLKCLKPHGLKIIESRYQIFKRRAGNLADFKDQIVGCVTRQGRLSALASAKCYLTFEKSLSTTTTQQWMSLEALGLGATIFHVGEMDVNDPRYSIVRNVKNFDQLIKLIMSPGNNDRSVLIDNRLTFADRLNQMANTVRYQERK